MSNPSPSQRVPRLVCMLLVLLPACAPRPILTIAPTATIPTPTESQTLAAHAPEIRFALTGSVKSANVWALFDEAGYSYNDYAIRSEYWPRLFHLSIPDGEFEPEAANGMPSAVASDGNLFSATVPLRTDLKWSDGSAFTADDVAFTVNMALGFELGFDWHAYYDMNWLDHAAAADEHTVKFYFKQAPGAAAWQYGALQGPIVQEKYWSPRIKGAAALQPAAGSVAQINTLNQKMADLQKRIDELVAESIRATGEEAHQLQGELRRRQGDMDEARNDLSSAQSSVDAARAAARQALYTLDGVKEPTLGTWLPGEQQEGIWTNDANPEHPFGEPHFDRATYILYTDQAAALAALEKGEVNALLDPQGLPIDLATHLAPQDTLISNATLSAKFLVINPARPALQEPTLRRALFCSIDRLTLARVVIGTPLVSFLPSGTGVWSNPAGTVSCGDGYDSLKSFDPSRAVSMLKSAGYSWSTEPAGEQAGVGLRAPDGQSIAPVALMAPPERDDAKSAQAAQIVERGMQYLGVPLKIQVASPGDIRFAVFSDGDYDMAIVGWRLGAYPGYLCDWFGAGNPFGYKDQQIVGACQKLNSTSDLGSTREQIFNIESALAHDPAFIPLFSGLTYDVTRGIRYPFEHVANGLSGVYGAPSLAYPAAP